MEIFFKHVPVTGTVTGVTGVTGSYRRYNSKSGDDRQKLTTVWIFF